ncbi:fork head domain transcription factor slp2-like [Ranitomeya imitator]|uniref:fork head domain transcription factor slp2-like n=1 Tax=Ranitomeya imitator TaxID=111125 RepID=UPI0037E73494
MSSAVHTLGASFLIDSLMGWTSVHHEKTIHPAVTENMQSKAEVIILPTDLLKSVTNYETQEKIRVTEDSQTRHKMDHSISSQENKMIHPKVISNTEEIKLETMERKSKEKTETNNCQMKEKTSKFESNQQEESNRLEKPNQSYIALISRAILSSPEKRLQLNDIYQWIMNTYPYYHNQDKSWRNSVRHNLSLNECFIKAGRSDNGKGHYWAVHPANLEAFSCGDYQRRRARRRIRRVSSVLGNPSQFPLYNLTCFHQRLCICCSSLYSQFSQTQICPLMENPHHRLRRSFAIPHLLPWNQNNI